MEEKIDSIHSEFKKRDVKFGKKFKYNEREWEVLAINKSSFNAKTIDNSPTKQKKIAQFIFKGE